MFCSPEKDTRIRQGSGGCGVFRREGSGLSLEGFSPSLEGSDLSLEGFSPSLEGSDLSLEGFSPSLEGFSPSLEGFSSSLEGFSPSWEGFEPSLASQAVLGGSRLATPASKAACPCRRCRDGAALPRGRPSSRRWSRIRAGLHLRRAPLPRRRTPRLPRRTRAPGRSLLPQLQHQHVPAAAGVGIDRALVLRPLPASLAEPDHGQPAAGEPGAEPAGFRYPDRGPRGRGAPPEPAASSIRGAVPRG